MGRIILHARATSESFSFSCGSTYAESQRNNSDHQADIDAGPALGARLLTDHGKRLVKFDCALRAVLLADSASGASELADLFYVTLACRVMSRPHIQDNVPSGSDWEYRDWLNLSVMDDINYTA